MYKQKSSENPNNNERKTSLKAIFVSCNNNTILNTILIEQHLTTIY